MRVVFTGGGTGGHFFPIIAVIRELKRIAEDEQILDLELFYMGPEEPWLGALRQEEVVIYKIKTGKMRTYSSIENFFDVFKTGLAILKAIWNMYIIYPDALFSKGGYGALPGVVAAIIFRIPIIIHESDSVPGKVNRFTARFATRIGIAFTSAEKYFPPTKTALVGIPVRKRILGGNRQQARENMSIFSDRPVLAFMGASQGSEHLNDAVLGILKELTDEYEVVHQTGATHFEGVNGEASVILEYGHKERYHPFGFMDELQIRDFYIASDMLVSRAGASSIFEIAAWGKPSLLIPLQHAAQHHQLRNAYEYAAIGACQILEESNLTPHILLSEIKKIIDNTERMKQMSEAAQRFSRIDADEIIAREILKIALHTVEHRGEAPPEQLPPGAK